MTKDSQTQTGNQTKGITDQSALAKFQLAFEYDITWDQAKQGKQSHSRKLARN